MSVDLFSPAYVRPQEGAAFAALNPPVNPERFLATPSFPDVPVSIVDHSAIVSQETAVRELTQALRHPKEIWRGAPVCGVVTVKNDNWRPTGPGQVPPSVTQGLGMHLSAEFAMIYNRSKLARAKHRWAVVTNRGTVLILSGIRSADRPTNPADLPPCVRTGMTYAESEETALEANGPRFALANVPREWAVAIRRIDCIDDIAQTVEGGAA